MAWCTGYAQHINVLPDGFGLLLQILQPVLRGKSIGCIKALVHIQHLANDGQQCFGLVFVNAACTHRALGHPGAVVQQISHLLQGVEGDGAHGSSLALQTCQKAAKCAFIGIRQLPRLWHAHAQLCQGLVRGNGGAGLAVTVCRIRPFHEGRNRRAVCHIQRQHPDAVQGAACRHQTSAGHCTGCGLEPHNLVKGSRYAARTSRVGGQCKRHQTASHHRRRTRAGPPRNQAGIQGVGHHAIGRACTDQARRKLVQIGFAQDDGTCIFQALHNGGICLCHIGKSRAGRSGVKARHIDVVLDRKRHPEQWKLRPPMLCFQGLQGLDLRMQLFSAGNADPGGVLGLQSQALLLQQLRRQGPEVVCVLPVVECANQHDEYLDVYKMPMKSRLRANCRGCLLRCF